MKKILFGVVISLLLVGGVASAQTQGITSKPGITPDSPFYFLDRWGEDIQEFFTFNKEAKAKLQIKFADERIAEIKILVETKGPEAKGIEKAKSLLIGNVSQAAEIIKEVKSSGKDVTKLAEELNSQFNEQEKLLVDTFQEARKKLNEDHIVAVQDLIKQAQKTGDLEKVKDLKKQAKELVSESKVLKEKKDEIKGLFREEKKKIEKELDSKDQEKSDVEKSKNDKQEELKDHELDKQEELNSEKRDRQEELNGEKRDRQEKLNEDRKDKEESLREDAKHNAEDVQRNLEKSLEDSNMTEKEREALKQAGEKDREDAKQNAETTNGTVPAGI